MNTSSANSPSTGFFYKRLSASRLYARPLIFSIFLTHAAAHADEPANPAPPVVTPTEQEQDFQDKQRLQEKINHELEDNRKRVLEQSIQNKKEQRRSDPSTQKNDLKGK